MSSQPVRDSSNVRFPLPQPFSGPSGFKSELSGGGSGGSLGDVALGDVEAIGAAPASLFADGPLDTSGGGAAVDAGGAAVVVGALGAIDEIDCDADGAGTVEGCGGGALALHATPAMAPVKNRNKARSIFIANRA
jgi:hypothetical protein